MVTSGWDASRLVRPWPPVASGSSIAQPPATRSARPSSDEGRGYGIDASCVGQTFGGTVAPVAELPEVTDVVVIGGGIVGASIAYHLAVPQSASAT